MQLTMFVILILQCWKYHKFWDKQERTWSHHHNLSRQLVLLLVDHKCTLHTGLQQQCLQLLLSFLPVHSQHRRSLPTLIN
jgi:lipoate-protein ligase B